MSLVKKLPLFLNRYRYPCYWGALLLLFLFFQSCNHNRYRDFNPEEIVNVPEAQLKTYADTASKVEIKGALAEQRKSMGMDITKECIQKMGKVKGQNLKIIDLLDNQGEALGTRVILQLPLKYRKEKTT